MKKILDLGCRDKKYQEEEAEVIGVDIKGYDGVDMVYDLNNHPYPFKDKSFDEIRAIHLIEHLDDINKFLSECVRIAIDRIIIRVSHFSNRDAFGHPDHKHFFTVSTFDYFVPDNNPQHEHHIKFPIEIEKRELHYKLTDMKGKSYDMINRIIDFFANLQPYLCERIWCHWVGGFSEVEIIIKIK